MPEPSAPLVLWRAYVPRWAFDPLSGVGAARFGGRWNAVGQPCLYAARELSTAFAEYNQGFVQHPATVVQLRLHAARLADLTDAGVLASLHLARDIHDCDWRDDLDHDRTPSTHVAARRLIRAGYHGVIYPSVMSRGGSCVALWQWTDPVAPRLEVVDPDGRLPKTPASWL